MAVRQIDCYGFETTSEYFKLTSGSAVWFTDLTDYVTEPGSARSGNIGDSQSNSLTATVIGPGHIQFKAKVSSESWYDKLPFYIDGNAAVDDFSGEQGWTTYDFDIAGDGTHASSAVQNCEQ